MLGQTQQPTTMRVFVTGTTGFIGHAVTKELSNTNQLIFGLVRSDLSASAVTKAGVTPHRGDIENIESLKNGAEACDGVTSRAPGNCRVSKQDIIPECTSFSVQPLIYKVRLFHYG